jgi:hypothetical protein
MEHRYEMRKPIELSVEIAAYGRRMGRYRTRNVSYSGMFIECLLIPVYVNNVVHLSVFHGEQQFDLRAVVIHRNNRGIGVMRLDYNEGYARFVMDELGLAGPHIVDELPVAALEGA